MVHIFECLARIFLLDVESGSVFEIDELAAYLVRKRISPKGMTEGDFSRYGIDTIDFDRYSQSEIDERECEIDQLIAEGVLFSEAEHQLRDGAGVVKAICLNITHDCNLRCTYCFADGGSYSGVRTHMSEQTAKAAVDFLIQKSATRRNLEIDFFGGEPILNFEVIKKTVRYAKEQGEKINKRFRFTVTTNALFLTDEHIEFFNKEMYNVVLSVDGRKHIHDRVRKTAGNKGSYDIVIDNILSFKKQRTGQYYVRGTFTADNLDFSEDVLFLNDIGLDQISIEPVVLAEDHPLAIKQQHLEQIFDQYERLAAEYLKRRSEGREFSFFHFNLDLFNSICETKRLKGCGAGCEYLCIAPDGGIYPCHQFDGDSQYRMGDLADGRLEKSIAKQFADSCVLTKAGCQECWAKYYCSGGCNAANIRYAGGINNVCKVSCQIMKKRLECAIAVNSLEKINN